MTTKKSLKSYMAEEGILSNEIIETPKTAETIKAVATRGRPKSKPASKAIIFHLPLDLIAQIDAEADRITTSNKSAFAVKVFSEYFAVKR